MSEETEKQILQELKEIKEDLKVTKEFISERDIMTNKEYCKLRKISRRKLGNWFEREINPCPRVDIRNVSKSAVDEWARVNNTKKPKS